MKKIIFKQETAKTIRGFSRWINPIMKGYLMKCCDCGLTHEFEFRVAVESNVKGKKWYTKIDDPAFKVEFRCKRTKY